MLLSESTGSGFEDLIFPGRVEGFVVLETHGIESSTTHKGSTPGKQYPTTLRWG